MQGSLKCMIQLLRCALACLIVAAIGAARTSSGAQLNPKAQDCALSPEDYGVYSAVLLNRGRPEDPEEQWDDKPDMIIEDVTEAGKDGDSNGWGFRSASRQRPNRETVDHFNLRRSSSCHLKPELDAAIPYRILSEQEIEGYFKKKGIRGWKDFYKKYPKSSGFWSFSPVGYNDEGTEALIYVGHHCGGLCGTGHLYLVAKENGHWIVKNRLMLWIS